MKLETVAQILEDAGCGEQGESIFINFMPTEKHGILLRQPFAPTPIDHELPGLRTTSFMLIIRALGHVAGDTLINRAMQALTIEKETEFPGVKFNYMRPRTEPLTYQPSPGNYIEFSTNIDCSYVLL